VTNIPEPQARSAFYAAAVLGLRALDARESTPRRFGTDAEARWEQFAGSLGAGDRIDILLRDAAGTWGAAFSPSECFGLFGLADDEPFGPDWGGIEDLAANRLLAKGGASNTLEQIAVELGLKVADVPVPAITSSTKLILAGGDAMVSVAKVFAESPALSWTDQVAVVAARPALRQLAALAAVCLGARGRTVLVRPSEDAESALRATGFSHLDAAVVSDDAEPEAGALARADVRGTCARRHRGCVRARRARRARARARARRPSHAKCGVWGKRKKSVMASSPSGTSCCCRNSRCRLDR
jgi:hypothetical protein